MLDYCGEEEFFPMDGDYDNYDSYTPNEPAIKMGYPKEPFMPNPNYYDNYVKFDRIIEREKCYSILRNQVWLNIPKKIVRKVEDARMLVYMPIFNDICAKAG